MKSDAGEPPPPEVPECTPQVPLTLNCVGCVCGGTAECALAVSHCDEACWDLLRCAYDRCLTTLDGDCIMSECFEQRAGREAAAPMFTCVTNCYGHCVPDLRRPPPDDMDAGR